MRVVLGARFVRRGLLFAWTLDKNNRLFAALLQIKGY